MIVAPDWLVLAFAITGIWFLASVVMFVVILILGRIFDLHLDMWQRRQQAKQAAHDVQRLIQEIEEDTRS